MDDEFAFLILSIVAEIPSGKVASYGQLARIAGYPRNARKVGKVLAHAERYGTYPCHRVVHSDGRLVRGWDDQKELLSAEGISFSGADKVDMSKYGWVE